MMPQTLESVTAIAGAIVFAMEDQCTRVLKVTD
jgi:hypothetical protein